MGLAFSLSIPMSPQQLLQVDHQYDWQISQLLPESGGKSEVHPNTVQTASAFHIGTDQMRDAFLAFRAAPFYIAVELDKI